MMNVYCLLAAGACLEAVPLKIGLKENENSCTALSVLFGRLNTPLAGFNLRHIIIIGRSAELCVQVME